jgi:hypothetical protein
VSQTSADFLRRMWRQASGEGCLWLCVVRLGLALGKQESQRFRKHTAIVIILPGHSRRPQDRLPYGTFCKLHVYHIG